MAYLLSGSEIRAPHSFNESNSTLVAQNKALDGTVNRDYFGSNKRVWELDYNNVVGSDYAVIKAIYDTYLSTNTPVSWEITETNYTISSTTVHLTLDNRGFKVRGNDYISDFKLTLVEV